MDTKPTGEDLELLLNFQDSLQDTSVPSGRDSLPTSRRVPRYKLNPDLAKECEHMKVNWYQRNNPTALNFRSTGCVGVPHGPNVPHSTCELEVQLHANGLEGGSGAPIPYRLYENDMGAQLCSCCAAHYPNSMLSLTRWRKLKDVEERPPRIVDHSQEVVRRERFCRANMRRVAENKTYAKRLRLLPLHKGQMYSIYFHGDEKEYKGCVKRVSTNTGQVEVRCCCDGKSYTWDAKLFYLFAKGKFQHRLVRENRVRFFHYTNIVDGNDVITLD